MIFQATLHDRSKNQSHPVEIALRPGSIFISFKNFKPAEEWFLNDISHAREADGLFILQNGQRFLEIESPNFREVFERSFPGNKFFRRGFFDKIGTTGCLISLLLLVLPLVALYKWGLPKLADNMAQKVSPEIERQIGDSWFKALTAQYEKDEAKTLLAQQFYDSLGFGGDYQIRITVVKEPVVNAFAVPGGQIVVFDSIIGLMESPEELAGLLAHEASHVQLKHSTRAIFRELANSMFFSLVLGNYGDVSGFVVQQADQLADLSYSRELEFEADDNGLKLLVSSNLPPSGIPNLFKKMKADVEKSGMPDVPDFLRTHPSMAERIEAAEAKIAALGRQDFEVRGGLRAVFQRLKNRGD